MAHAPSSPQGIVDLVNDGTYHEEEEGSSEEEDHYFPPQLTRSMSLHPAARAAAATAGHTPPRVTVRRIPTTRRPPSPVTVPSTPWDSGDDGEDPGLEVWEEAQASMGPASQASTFSSVSGIEAVAASAGKAKRALPIRGCMVTIWPRAADEWEAVNDRIKGDLARHGSVDRAAWQWEEGSKEALHCHVAIVFKKKLRFNEDKIFGEWFRGAFCKPAEVTATKFDTGRKPKAQSKAWLGNVAYCTKEKGRVHGPFYYGMAAPVPDTSDEEIAIIDGIPILPVRLMYPWQRNVISILDPTVFHKRQCLFLWDAQTGTGKTSLLRYLVHRHPEFKDKTVFFQTALIRDQDLGYMFANFHEQHKEWPTLVVFDMPKATIPKKIDWTSVERVMNGMLSSTKYECRCLSFPPPMCVFLTNFKPNPYGPLSTDRICIISVQELNASDGLKLYYERYPKRDTAPFARSGASAYQLEQAGRAGVKSYLQGDSPGTVVVIEPPEQGPSGDHPGPQADAHRARGGGGGADDGGIQAARSDPARGADDLAVGPQQRLGVGDGVDGGGAGLGMTRAAAEWRIERQTAGADGSDEVGYCMHSPLSPCVECLMDPKQKENCDWGFYL
jgi:hypothetical protein